MANWGIMGAIGGIGEGLASTGDALVKGSIDQSFKLSLQDAMTNRALALATLQDELKRKNEDRGRERIGKIVAGAQGAETNNNPDAAAGAGLTRSATFNSVGDGGQEIESPSRGDEGVGVNVQQGVKKPANRQEVVDALVRAGEVEAAKAIAATDKSASWQDVMLAKIAAGERNTDRRATATENAAETRAEAVRDSAETRAAATREAAETKAGSLTKMEVIRNREIDLARQKIADLSPEDIKRKTQKFTNTGRENPDFDEALARRVTLANRRKAGEDSFFDSQLKQMDAQTNAPPALKMRSGDEILREFVADSAMKARGYKMGKKTDNGYEVLDAKGNVVGHYR